MKKTSIIPSLSVLIFGLAMSFLALYFMLEKQSVRILGHTLTQAYELKDEVVEEFLWSENVLRGIDGFFQSSQEVSRKEFKTFCANSIPKGIPLHLVEWQPKIPGSKRELFEKVAQKDGLKDFHFFEIDKDGKEVIAKKRDFHFPNYYSYSPLGEYQALGLDLAFSPIRMKSKYVAMKTGVPVLSKTFDIIIKGNTERNPGFAITHAIFNDPSISSSPNIDDLRGFVAIVLDLKEFFSPLSKKVELKKFQYEVFDQGDDAKLIFSTLSKGRYVEKYKKTIDIAIGGRSWRLVVYPTKSFIESVDSNLHWVIFILINLISAVLGVYLYINTERIEKINRYEKQIHQKQRLESLGVLASGIAHEFNNILHCISLANENLKFTRIEDVKKENIEVSLDYCRRGQSLVRQILSFARKESGALKELIPSQEILSTLKLITPSLKKGVEIRTKIESEKDTPMKMNVNHISQILINLINNAAHSMNDSGVININYHVLDKERVLTVTDSGEGMAEDIVQQVFDPFFTTKPVNEGTGLGLSVIYGIVKSYDGEIVVNSVPGRGSEFKVILPL